MAIDVSFKFLAGINWFDCNLTSLLSIEYIKNEGGESEKIADKN